jgi:hypothetical protein
MAFDPVPFALQLLAEQHRADLAREARSECLAALVERGREPSPTDRPRRYGAVLRRLVLAVRTTTRARAGRVARPLA